jgi:signal transduction histidine kinase
MARRSLLITYIATYLLAVGSIIRYLVLIRDDRVWPVALLVSAYLVLLVLEPFAIRQHRLLTYVYLLVQTATICTIAVIAPAADYWAVLFCPLVVQVMHNFPQRTGFLITGIMTVIASIFLLLVLGPEVGLPLILVYAVIYYLLAAFIAIILEAEAARKESQGLLADLQVAHQELQAHTGQAEELAAIAERNRLARNLHDSVSQTVFSMTLMAEAARILLDHDASRAAQELDKLQALAKSALAEMRSLVFELRPTAVTEKGLVPALRHHMFTLDRQHGLIVSLQVEGEPQLTDLEAQRLFRVIQEALNNVVKHARTDRASVALQFEDGRVLARIEDEGQGFTPATASTAGQGIGLSTMRERVEMMGGTLAIDSSPGAGTWVTVELFPESGRKNNG